MTTVSKPVMDAQHVSKDIIDHSMEGHSWGFKTSSPNELSAICTDKGCSAMYVAYKRDFSIVEIHVALDYALLVWTMD